MKRLLGIFVALVFSAISLFSSRTFAYIDPSYSLLNIEINQESPEMVEINDAWMKFYEKTTDEYGYDELTADKFDSLKAIAYKAYQMTNDESKKKQLAYLFQLTHEWKNTTSELNKVIGLEETETTEKETENVGTENENSFASFPFSCVEKTDEMYIDNMGNASCNESYVLVDGKIMTEYNEVCGGGDAVSQDDAIYKPLFNAFNDGFTNISNVAIVGDTNILYGYVDGSFETIKVYTNSKTYNLPEGTTQVRIMYKYGKTSIDFLTKDEKVSQNGYKNTYLSCEIK